MSKMTLPDALQRMKGPVLDTIYWCPVREAFFRGEYHDRATVWVAYTRAGSYPPELSSDAERSLKELCGRCGLTFGSHCPGREEACPQHEGRMDWRDDDPGATFVPTGTFGTVTHGYRARDLPPAPTPETERELT